MVTIHYPALTGGMLTLTFLPLGWRRARQFRRGGVEMDHREVERHDERASQVGLAVPPGPMTAIRFAGALPASWHPGGPEHDRLTRAACG